MDIMGRHFSPREGGRNVRKKDVAQRHNVSGLVKM